MKTIVTVSFNSGDAPWRTVRSVFDACRLSQHARRGPDPVGVYFVSLEPTSPTLDYLTIDDVVTEQRVPRVKFEPVSVV